MYIHAITIISCVITFFVGLFFQKKNTLLLYGLPYEKYNALKNSEQIKIRRNWRLDNNESIIEQLDYIYKQVSYCEIKSIQQVDIHIGKINKINQSHDYCDYDLLEKLKKLRKKLADESTLTIECMSCGKKFGSKVEQFCSECLYTCDSEELKMATQKFYDQQNKDK